MKKLVIAVLLTISAGSIHAQSWDPIDTMGSEPTFDDREPAPYVEYDYSRRSGGMSAAGAFGRALSEISRNTRQNQPRRVYPHPPNRIRCRHQGQYTTCSAY